MARFRGRDITSFRPADVHLGADLNIQSISPRTAASRSIQSMSHITFLGLSPWRDVMCDMLCMLGEAAVRGLIDCIFIDKYWHEMETMLNAILWEKKENLQSFNQNLANFLFLFLFLHVLRKALFPIQ